MDCWLLRWLSPGLAADLRANYFSANDDFHASIFLTPGCSRIISDRHILTEAGRGDGIHIHALLHEIIANSHCSLFRKFLVEGGRASGIGVPFHLQFQSWIGEHNAG